MAALIEPARHPDIVDLRELRADDLEHAGQERSKAREIVIGASRDPGFMGLRGQAALLLHQRGGDLGR